MAEQGKSSVSANCLGYGRLTQKEIAEALDVSPSVVSLVMKNPDTRRASEETKQRILALLKRNPGSGRHASDGDTLLVVNKPELNVYYFQSKMLYGIQSRAAEVRLKVHIASPAQDMRSYVFGTPLRGLLLTAPDTVTEQVIELAKTTFAITLNPQEHGTFTGDAIFPDYYSGMNQSVKHLLDFGHRRIGYIGERPVKADCRARERLHDFREACEVLNCALDESDVHLYAHGENDEGDWAAVDGILGQWQKLKRRPSAFVVYNDNLAVKFYQVAQSLGLRIPDDVSLVGYDNEPVCEHLLPKLTSVSPEFYNLGRMAVDLLMSRKEAPADMPGRKIICPVRLIVRDSVCRKKA
jgi:DNA-binding LacI/PurR family transcriptional regulator